MDDDRLDDLLRDAARDYHSPGPTPREEIWAGIEQRRSTARLVRRRWSPRRWVPLAAAAAVVLGAGIGIGRLTDGPGPDQPVAATPAARSSGEVNATAYRLATLEHLSQSEDFLTLFRSSVGQGDHRLASATARQLLGTNRLLLDSPAAMDRRTRLLLEDLELVLAGIAQLSQGGRRQDVDLITEGMERGHVMPRLRTAVPSGAASSQGAL
jgi:hypothetical protein